VLYTSGTTGLAKAISTPHGNLTFGRGPEGFRSLGDPEPLLAPIPLGTTSSATTMAIALTTPSTLVLCPVGNVERMAELVARYRIKSFMITPWIGIQAVAARVHERHDLSCVDTVATASAPMPPRIARALLEMMPRAQLNSVYAAREAVPAVVMATFDPARPFAVGRPARGTDLLVVDEHGQPVPAGRIGEIWLRCQAPKRLCRDGADRAAQGEDDWTRTRDLGYLDEDGELHLFDREADAVRVNGTLVSTIEVEAVLFEHPAVQQVAVLGVPGAGGEPELTAFLVLPGGEDVEEIRQFATGRLAPAQVPVAYHVVDALPRGIMGKVLKHELRTSVRVP
jgi:fatty-acyl-CoA synthase